MGRVLPRTKRSKCGMRERAKGGERPAGRGLDGTPSWPVPLAGRRPSTLAAVAILTGLPHRSPVLLPHPPGSELASQGKTRVPVKDDLDRETCGHRHRDRGSGARTLGRSARSPPGRRRCRVAALSSSRERATSSKFHLVDICGFVDKSPSSGRRDLCPHCVERARLVASTPHEPRPSLRHRGGQPARGDAPGHRADTNHPARDEGDPGARRDACHDRVVRAESHHALGYHPRRPEPRLEPPPVLPAPRGARVPHSGTMLLDPYASPSTERCDSIELLTWHRGCLVSRFWRRRAPSPGTLSTDQPAP
jgi:hypothetical protein